MKTYNIATGASSINESVITHGFDFAPQVQEDFVPNYGLKMRNKWHSTTTLFAIFMGINDVQISAENTTAAERWDLVYQYYNNLSEQVYINPLPPSSPRSMIDQGVLKALPKRPPQLPLPLIPSRGPLPGWQTLGSYIHLGWELSIPTKWP